MKKIIKAQFVGNETCLIYIPKDIVKELKITKGEYLSIETSENSAIIKKVEI